MRLIGKSLCIIILCSCLFLSSCDRPPVPEKLPLSVRNNLNLLLKDAQFMMYMNFKSMRGTEFWQKNLSDSIITQEQTFGSILNLFGKVTGATISNGLDELYYANSWFGENSIVLKGVFKKESLDNFIASDTTFTKIKHSDGTEIYKSIDDNLFFYLKDNVTLCASNYQSQLDRMMKTTDTTGGGLLENAELMQAIEGTIYKKDLMMVSTERMFIRGIFLNFFGTGQEQPMEDGGQPGGEQNPEQDGLDNIYEKVRSISFSVNMTNDLKLMVQNRCDSEESSNSIRRLLNGLLTFSRIGAAVKTDEEKSAIEEMLNSIEVKNFGNDVFLEVNVDEGNIKSFQNKRFIDAPPTQ